MSTQGRQAKRRKLRDAAKQERNDAASVLRMLDNRLVHVEMPFDEMTKRDQYGSPLLDLVIKKPAPINIDLTVTMKSMQAMGMSALQFAEAVAKVFPAPGE